MVNPREIKGVEIPEHKRHFVSENEAEHWLPAIVPPRKWQEFVPKHRRT